LIIQTKKVISLFTFIEPKTASGVDEMFKHGYSGLRFDELVFFGIGFQPGGNLIDF
jgi:hypothetical protein